MTKNEPKLSESSDNKPTGELHRDSSWLTFRVALFSFGLLWLSFPPTGIWPLAWIAPVPLIWLCSVRLMPGIRPYRSIWLASVIYWLATFYFVPIPHWALWFGWIVLSVYLSMYPMLFVAATRTMRHRWNLPLWIAAPIAWTGVEWFRCVFLSGMGLVCLSHTQFKQPLLIQVADLSGAYTLTFLMIMFASLLFGWPILTEQFERETHWINTIGAAAILGGILGYGQFRLAQTNDLADQSMARIALIQGSIDTDLSNTNEVLEQKFNQYSELTWRARTSHQDIDIIVWPEGNFPLIDVVPELGRPDLAGVDDFDAVAECKALWSHASGFPDKFNTPVPFFCGTRGSYGTDKAYNSAVLISEKGLIEERYFKHHRVMFGEYFPILEWVPSFQAMFGSIDSGNEDLAIDVNGVKLATNICFETTVPYFVRKQVNRLSASGSEPDAILNVTNDGWFYGTAALDFHLACNVFRAVELRKPNLVCANTGFSAHISSNGELLQCGPRRDTQVIVAEVGRISGTSPYRTIGDLLPIVFGIISLFAALLGWRFRQNVDTTE